LKSYDFSAEIFVQHGRCFMGSNVFTWYLVLVAQEVEPVVEVPITETEVYSDGNDRTVSYIEALLKSSTSTPELSRNYIDEQVVETLKRIEHKLDLIIKRK